jgi:hypothetical protein
MSDLKFSRDGRYMLARDFMTLKLWDVNMEASPVATYPIHEHLKPRVCTVQSTPRPLPDLLLWGAKAESHAPGFFLLEENLRAPLDSTYALDMM